MADINIDSAVINSAADELKQAKEIIDLQCNTLNEVAQIIENSFQCSETVRLRNCVNSTRQKLEKTGDEFKDIANSLQCSIAVAKMADKFKTSMENIENILGGGFH